MAEAESSDHTKRPGSAEVESPKKKRKLDDNDPHKSISMEVIDPAFDSRAEFISGLKKAHEVLLPIFDDSEQLCIDILAFSIETDVNDHLFQFRIAEKMLEFCSEIPYKLPGVLVSARQMSPSYLVTALKKLGANSNAINIRGDFYKQCLCMESNDVAEILHLNHSSLLELDLRHNMFDDSDAIKFAEAIAVNTSLKTLHLGYNCLRKKSVTKIAEAIALNSSLEHFDLAFLINHPSGYGGSLDEESVVAFVQALAANTSLKSVFWVQHNEPFQTERIQVAIGNATMKRRKAGLPNLNIQRYGKENDSFNESISRVAKMCHPEMYLPPHVLTFVKNLLKELLGRVTSSMAKKNLTNAPDCVTDAIKIVLLDQLKNHAVLEVTKCYQKWKQSEASKVCSGLKGLCSREDRAGLVFDTARIEECLHIKNKDCALEVAVCLAALMEYICVEITELSGYIALDRAGKAWDVTMTCEDVKKGIEQDSELQALYERVNMDQMMDSV